MYKIMLIDDDVPMLKYLEKLVQWNSLELTICAAAYSPMRALQLFDSTLPDIVISDIGLPQINGLELAEKFRELKPDVRMIFLTCHEDFHYAKRAVQLGADEYLIKDELTSEQLEKSLRKSLQHLKDSQDNLELYSFRETIQINKEVLKQNFLEQILSGKNIENILGYGKKLGIHWVFPDFIMGKSFIDFSTLPEKYSLRDILFIKFGILNIAEELAQNVKGMTPILDKENNLYIIFNFKYTISQNTFEEYHRFLVDLQQRVNEYLKINLSFLYSRNIVKRANLGDEIVKLSKSRYQAFYLDSSISGLHSNHRSDWHINSNEMLKPLGNELMKAFDHNDLPTIFRTIDELEALSIEKHINPKQLIDNGERWISYMDVKSGNSLKSEEFAYFLKNSVKLKDFILLLKNKAEQLMSSMEDKQNDSRKKPKLQEIDQFIMEHLSENISSADMANFLFLNPSYFSRYFKRLAGENFTDYIHRFKMKTAEKLLKEKEDSIEIIASQLGYSDRTYFSKIFKKHTGYSPGEYKSRQANKILT
ncbi:response regulator transcription factor [Neobacillus bataviensis]|uniref:response regulator transcription factor n=1 Tax=Neobacillus bataviensis TaxID=220685 RepID=UPI001CBF65D9|nr:response regulator [Neobacillus bataviensis]